MDFRTEQMLQTNVLYRCIISNVFSYVNTISVKKSNKFSEYMFALFVFLCYDWCM